MHPAAHHGEPNRLKQARWWNQARGWLATGVARLIAGLTVGLIGLVLVGWLAQGASAAAAIRLQVALEVGNVHQFSARDKTYNVEGTLRLSAPAAVMQRLESAGVEPVELLRFQNLVDPWDSLLEPNSGWLQRGTNLGRDYRFHGKFYSDEINYRGYPFGTLPLQISVVPVGQANGAIRAYPFDGNVSTSPTAQLGPGFNVQLEANSAESSVSRQTNMNGFRLKGWRLIAASGDVEMQVFYAPIGWASLVKWLLPLAITMVVMLLTPNLRKSFSSERLAIPPVILLTLVFMQQAYRESLPTLPYLTVLDGLYAFSYLVTLVFFCEFIWCANRIDRLKENYTARSDRHIGQLERGLQLASLAGYAVLLVWALAIP